MLSPVRLVILRRASLGIVCPILTVQRGWVAS
jgi:hypothetical protein